MFNRNRNMNDNAEKNQNRTMTECEIKAQKQLESSTTTVAMSTPSALVIGTGMIGAEVVRQLREKGVKVFTAGHIPLPTQSIPISAVPSTLYVSVTVSQSQSISQHVLFLRDN